MKISRKMLNRLIENFIFEEDEEKEETEQEETKKEKYSFGDDIEYIFKSIDDLKVTFKQYDDDNEYGGISIVVESINGKEEKSITTFDIENTTKKLGDFCNLLLQVLIGIEKDDPNEYKKIRERLISFINIEELEKYTKINRAPGVDFFKKFNPTKNVDI